MTAARDTLEIRLKSARAPYTRAGIRFASNRETVVLTGAQVSDDQLVRLSEDTAISIEIVDPATGARIDMAKPVDTPADRAPPAGDALVMTQPTAPAEAPGASAAERESGGAAEAGAGSTPAPAQAPVKALAKPRSKRAKA